MLFFRLLLLVFYIDTTTLHKHGKQNENVYIIVNSDPSRHFHASKNVKESKGGYNSNFARILTLDNDEHYSGEVYSTEVDSSIRNFGFRRSIARVVQNKVSDNSSSDNLISSSSVDTIEFKEEWSKRMNELKLDALIHAKDNPRPDKDRVNMVAARPWSKPCGDPTQGQVLWGTCTLQFECEDEYRIYKGDTFCGRTEFVCCGVIYTDNDLNKGFDVSFAESTAFSASSEEKLKAARGSRENRQRKRLRKKQTVKSERDKRIKNIKKAIRKISKHVRKLLNRAYNNNTLKRYLVNKNFKTLIKTMKHQYKNERKVVTEKHEDDWMHITKNLQNKLSAMRLINDQFLTNETFRNIVVNATMKKSIGRKLLAYYPELAQFPEMKELQDTSETILNKTRRSGIGRSKRSRSRVYLQYEI